MADMAFNTIAEIQRLRDAGFEQAQAEAITLSIHSGVTGGVATKADLEHLEERLEVTIEAKIATAKLDLTWRLLGGIAVLNGVMFALLRYLPPPG